MSLAVQYGVTYLEDKHVLTHVLRESQEASFRVVPCVRVDLLFVRVQRLDDAGYTEFEVTLRTV
jgi:hypothetical protein